MHGDISPLRSLSLGERERIVQGILASTWGIYGMEVCQLCGKLSTYSGWASAIGSHRHREFLCSRHRKSPGAQRTLAATATRWCELCQARVTRSSAERVRSYWLCAECAPDVDAVDDRSRLLHDVGRRRYLEARCVSDRKLLEWARARGVPGCGG